MSFALDRCKQSQLSAGHRLNIQTIGKMFFPSFLLALAFNINTLVDGVLAGVFFTPSHIAAITVGATIQYLFIAVLDIVVKGTYSNYSLTLRRGQRRKSREVFSLGMVSVFSVGTIFVVLSLFFAEPLVELFGATTPKLRELAAQYLRFSAPAYPIISISKMLTLSLGTYGYQKDTFYSNLVKLGCNILFSLLFVLWIPEIGIGALGLGTMFSTVPAIVLNALAVRRRKLPLGFRFTARTFSAKRLREMFSSGIGDSLNGIAEALVQGLANRIVMASVLGEVGLSAFSIIFCFWQLACVSAEGIGYAAQPLFGLHYAMQDKENLKSTIAAAVRIGIGRTLIWMGLIFVASPLLLRVYTWNNNVGESLMPILQKGVFATLIFAPCYCMLTLFVCYFSATGCVRENITFAILPDSVLAPILLAILLPRMGYWAIWLALGGNGLLFLALFYVGMVLRKRRLHITLEEAFKIDREEEVRQPLIEEVFKSHDGQIPKLSERIQQSLKDAAVSSKTAYISALCVDELIQDIVTNALLGDDPSVFGIRIIDTDAVFRIIIYDYNHPYNPLDFVQEDLDESFGKIGVKMVQRIAKKIDYNYIYNMNLLMIQLEK